MNHMIDPDLTLTAFNLFARMLIFWLMHLVLSGQPA
jgi:hypothetical protein